ncbi:MAG: ImmA/IrrE family metallo-endopeptidase [Gemmatimonadota bacterium]
MLGEVVNRIRVAGIQVYRRPTIVIDVVRKLSLKALYLPDSKRILLDAALPEKKHRWNETHEIVHSLLPWHIDTMLGDNVATLSQDCHDQVESEANFGAGRLLFLQDRFREEARSLTPCIDAVKVLGTKFGNTISTTLHRFVELAGTDRPMVGMISDHPHVSRRRPNWNPLAPCRYFIQSPSFATKFSKITEVAMFRQVSAYCGGQSGGSLGEAEIMLADDLGDHHIFHFETFFNRYDALSLGMYLRPTPRQHFT